MHVLIIAWPQFDGLGVCSPLYISWTSPTIDVIPKQKIQDADELADYQMRKRKEFEDNIRKNRVVMTNWLKYAKWEENQNTLGCAGEIRANPSEYHMVTGGTNNQQKDCSCNSSE